MKTRFLTILFLPISFLGFGQVKKATISGVVTYYHNEFQGYKPDIGANVFFIPKSEDNYKKIKVLDSLIYADESDTGYNKLDKRAHDIIIDLYVENQKAVVDGAGRYSYSLDPGDYYVLFRSSGRRGLARTELLGKIYLQRLTVSEGENIDLSKTFEMH